MTDTETIAVLGAGSTMGAAMADNLLKAGFAVRAWNRTRERAEHLGERGATVVDSPAQAAQGATVVLTMLADADAVLSVIDAASPAADTLWLQMSTVGLGGTDRCIAFAAEHDLRFLDAPVLGTKAPAEEGKLVVLAAGPADLKERVSPIFDAVGQRTIWLGEAGQASRLKLATNSWVLTVVEGTAETLAFAEGLGLDPRLVLDALSGGPLDLPYLQMKGKAILERDFRPSFALKLAAKDAGLMVEAAQEAELDLPLIATISQRLSAGIGAHGDEDMIATYLTSAPAQS